MRLFSGLFDDGFGRGRRIGRDDRGVRDFARRQVIAHHRFVIDAAVLDAFLQRVHERRVPVFGIARSEQRDTRLQLARPGDVEELLSLRARDRLRADFSFLDDEALLEHIVRASQRERPPGLSYSYVTDSSSSGVWMRTAEQSVFHTPVTNWKHAGNISRLPLRYSLRMRRFAAAVVFAIVACSGPNEKSAVPGSGTGATDGSMRRAVSMLGLRSAPAERSDGARMPDSVTTTPAPSNDPCARWSVAQNPDGSISRSDVYICPGTTYKLYWGGVYDSGPAPYPPGAPFTFYANLQSALPAGESFTFSPNPSDYNVDVYAIFAAAKTTPVGQISFQTGMSTYGDDPGPTILHVVAPPSPPPNPTSDTSLLIVPYGSTGKITLADAADASFGPLSWSSANQTQYAFSGKFMSMTTNAPHTNTLSFTPDANSTVPGQYTFAVTVNSATKASSSGPLIVRVNVVIPTKLTASYSVPTPRERARPTDSRRTLLGFRLLISATM